VTRKRSFVKSLREQDFRMVEPTLRPHHYLVATVELARMRGK